MPATFIPVNDALKALATAGHDVMKLSTKQARANGFGECRYLVNGYSYSLSQVRAMVTECGLEKTTRKETEKPRREIETIAEAIAKDPGCQALQIHLSCFGERGLDGRVKYSFTGVKKNGDSYRKRVTLQVVRDWATRNGVI